MVKYCKVAIAAVVCIVAIAAVAVHFYGKGPSVKTVEKKTQNTETVQAGTEPEDGQNVAEAATSSEEKQKLSMNLGEVFQLAPGEGELLSCQSSDPDIVMAAEDGSVYALKGGSAEVTVKSGTDGDEKTIIYTVKVKKRGMVYPAFSMMKGERLDLQFSLKKASAKWESADPSVASVTKGGKVSAKKVGETILTGKSSDGKVYCCRLSVTKRIQDVIYLTFDDGPNRYTTTKILDILKKHDVKATFFELRPAGNDFDLTKRVLDEGHTLAMHGYQHKYDIIYRSQKIYRENLDKLRDLFFDKFGVWCTVTRFPGGSSNTVSRYNPGIMTKLTEKLHGWGYHYFDWNVDSEDAGGARSEKDTFRNFKNGLQKGRGNVVLMHDFTNNDKTIDALERMIRYGKKNGYTFLPIIASTDEVHHSVNN